MKKRPKLSMPSSLRRRAGNTLFGGLMLAFLLLVADASAQADVCLTALVDAEYAYAQGRFDEAIASANVCLEASDASTSDLDQAYRILGLGHLANDQPDDARTAVETLLERVPDYQTDADPEAFAAFLEQVREDVYTTRAGDEKDYVEVEVFYGTDREATGSDDPSKYYGGERGVYQVGTCMVSIPKGHQVGELESPAWYRFEFSENPSKHLVLHEVTPMRDKDMYAKMKASLAASGEQAVLVFVHGYNVTFQNAARRTAQLAYDLGFDGVPAFFSWPANGNTLDYPADEADVQWTIPHVRAFLEDVVDRSGARKVHLIAHSMGNRAVTAALRQIAAARSGPVFNQIMLAAPDVDADVFARDIVPAIRPVADRITLYASSADKALQLSNKIHQYPRAGESGDHVVVLKEIDTVDASEVHTDLLGHSYFAETETLLSDVHLLLRHGDPPAKRNLLEKLKSGIKFWLIH